MFKHKLVYWTLGHGGELIGRAMLVFSALLVVVVLIAQAARVAGAAS